MIDAPAGTGKTFTERVLASRLRGQGNVVLYIIVASTALALPLSSGPVVGQLKLCLHFPSMIILFPVLFAILKENLYVQNSSGIHCDFIIFDEICVVHKHCVEELDTTLRDL